MFDVKRWFYGLGVVWILATAIYFHAHFIAVFIQANREAIAALWD